MTNGELFIVENPNIKYKLNGSCVWIYFDGVNHYTMPTLWWEQEISLFDKIRAEIEQNAYPIVHGVNNHEKGMTLYGILQIIDKYREVSE